MNSTAALISAMLPTMRRAIGGPKTFIFLARAVLGTWAGPAAITHGGSLCAREEVGHAAGQHLRRHLRGANILRMPDCHHDFWRLTDVLAAAIWPRRRVRGGSSDFTVM